MTEAVGTKGVLETRQEFLRSFERLSAGRGSGANPLADGDDSRATWSASG